MPLFVLSDETTLASAAAERVAVLVEESIAARHNAVVCLAGGRSPRRLYEHLADAGRPWRGRIDWTRVHLFWGDERHVPPDHPESNFGMAHRALIAHVPIPPSQVRRIRGELGDPGAAARDYESALGEGFARAGRADQAFDVMLLGLGTDAHIASIFPGSPLLDTPDSGSTAPRVAAVWAGQPNAWRITLTPRALLDARAILVVVSGGEKAEAMRAALDLPQDVSRWPAQLLRAADDRVEWFTDAAAARWRDATRA